MESELQQDLQDDRQLAVGSQVTVRWPHHGYSFEARGVVLRLERFRAEVRLLAPLPDRREFPGVRVVSVPRCGNFMEWSSSWSLRLLRR